MNYNWDWDVFFKSTGVANRMIFMDQGQIIEDCPKEEFFGDISARSERAQQFF